MNELRITKVTIKISNNENEKLKGWVTIILNESFVIRNIKIIRSNGKLFISMPSQKFKDGSFHDIIHPLNRQTRQMIEEKILSSYFEMINNKGAAKINCKDKIENKRVENLKKIDY